MKSITNSFARNLAAVAAYAIVAMLLSRAAGLTRIDVALDVAHLVAATLAFALARRLVARVAMFALALLIAASAAELAIHSAFGIRAAQGLEAHLAVFLSAGIALTLALFVAPRPTQSSPEKI